MGGDRWRMESATAGEAGNASVYKRFLHSREADARSQESLVFASVSKRFRRVDMTGSGKVRKRNGLQAIFTDFRGFITRINKNAKLYKRLAISYESLGHFKSLSDFLSDSYM